MAVITPINTDKKSREKSLCPACCGCIIKSTKLVWFLIFAINTACMKTINTFSALLLFIVLAFSCKKEDTMPAYNTNTAGLNEPLMLQLVNDQRARGCNCGTAYYPPANPVSWNDLLETAAYAHANDMNKNNYFNHTGLDGSSPGDRIARAGYPWRAYGENIAKGFTTEQSVMEA